MRALTMKFPFITGAVLAACLLYGPLCAAKSGDAPKTEPKKEQPAGAAQDKSLTREEIQKSLIVRDCYAGCKERIADGVIPRSDGMACMDICVSDSLAALTGPGRISGRIYVKFADGRIEKGLKIPVRLLALANLPENASKEITGLRDGIIELINKSLSAGKSIACASSEDFKTCGLGLEKGFAGFTLSAGTTDIEEGIFSVAGIPEGSYVLMVDWFRPNSQDMNTGSLFRWLIPVLIGEQKRINIELNEKNISYIMLNFPRSMVNE